MRGLRNPRVLLDATRVSSVKHAQHVHAQFRRPAPRRSAVPLSIEGSVPNPANTMDAQREQRVFSIWIT